jgi:hypothetical protein
MNISFCSFCYGLTQLIKIKKMQQILSFEAKQESYYCILLIGSSHISHKKTKRRQDTVCIVSSKIKVIFIQLK